MEDFERGTTRRIDLSCLVSGCWKLIEIVQQADVYNESRAVVQQVCSRDCTLIKFLRSTYIVNFLYSSIIKINLQKSALHNLLKL